MKDVIKTQQPNSNFKLINGQNSGGGHRRRRNNLKNYYAMAIVSAAIIVMILCLTVFFKIKTVEINGVDLYSNEQIFAVGGITTGVNLVRIDTDVIEKRLADNLVYVDEIKVTKKYPSTLKVEIVQAKKQVEIEHGGKYYVMSKSGRILESANAEHNDKMILVKGFELKSLSPNDKVESQDTLKTKILTQLLDAIDRLDFKKIKSIDLTGRTDIKLDYDGRIEIKLGSSMDLDYKLNYIKAVIDNHLTDTYEGTLRYNGTSSGISAIPKVVDSKPDSKPETSSAVESSEGAVDASTDYDTGYDDYDTGYDDYDTGYDDYDTGYDDYDTGYDDYDTGYDDYNTGYNDYDTGYNDYGGEAW